MRALALPWSEKSQAGARDGSANSFARTGEWKCCNARPDPNASLADNPFYRSFGDTIALTDEAKVLPDMQGSGALRDLREASSLSPELASALAAYSAADTKAGQMALVDGVISQWAGSSGFQTSIEKADAQGYRLTYLIPGLSPADLSSGSFVSSGGGSSGGSGTLVRLKCCMWVARPPRGRHRYGLEKCRLPRPQGGHSSLLGHEFRKKLIK